MVAKPFFHGLDDADFKVLEQVLQEKSLAAGDVLFHEGDPVSGFYVLVEGGVEILKKNTAGDYERMATLGPGQAVGEMGLIFDEKKRTATVRCVESTLALFFPIQEFSRMMLKGDPSINKILLSVARTLATRLEVMNHEMMVLVQKADTFVGRWAPETQDASGAGKMFPTDFADFKKRLGNWKV